MEPSAPAAARLPVRRKQAPITERWMRDQSFRSYDITAALSERVAQDKEEQEAVTTALHSVKHALYLSAHLLPVTTGIAVTHELGILLDRLEMLQRHNRRASADHQEAYRIARQMAEHFQEAA